jgi:hypothetical protein
MLTQFAVFAVTDIRRARVAGKGLEIVLEGGPLDGVEEEIPLLGAGVMASRMAPDGCGSERMVDYWYERTKRKTRDGRLVCRYGGVRSRA